MENCNRGACEGSGRPEDPTFHLALYTLAFLANDEAGMAAQEQSLASKPDYEHFGLSLAADTEAYHGQLKKARESTQRAVSSAVRGRVLPCHRPMK